MTTWEAIWRFLNDNRIYEGATAGGKSSKTGNNDRKTILFVSLLNLILDS